MLAPGAIAANDSAIEQAISLRAADRLDEALDVLRLESRTIKEAEGDDSPRLLPINDLAAEILVAKGELETAATLLGKTIPARQKLVDSGKREHSKALGDSLLTLARLEMTAKRLPAAIDAARRALIVFDEAPVRDDADIARAGGVLVKSVESLDSLLGPDAEATREAHAVAAAVFASRGMFSEAIDQRHQMLAALASRRDAGAGELLEASDQLGRLMLAAGRASDAIAIVETSLAALEQAHPMESNALRRLVGELQLAAEKHVLAEGSFTQALEATEAAPKPSAVVVAGDRLRCLLVELCRGDTEHLPDWFDAAVKTLSRPDQSELSNALAALVLAGRAQETVGNASAAAAIYGQALPKATSAKPPDAGRAVDFAARLAAAQAASGDAASARTTVDRVLPTAIRDLGPGDFRVGFLRLALAEALRRQGETDKSVAVAVEALARGLPRPDDAWEASATATYDQLASVGDHADLRERYLTARARQFGENHPHVAAACGLFGAARLAAGDWPAAIDFFTRAAEKQRSTVGDDNPDVAASLVLLAHAQREAGEPKRAVETATRALATWERTAGADHPGTLSAVDVLATSKLQAGDTTGVVELLERLCAADETDDLARRATHLARLADLTVPRDKARAKELLKRAMELPCWNDEGSPRPGLRRRLALTAALAAHAFRTAGDADAATAAVQRARELALRDSDDPKPLLDRIDQIASHGDRPASAP